MRAPTVASLQCVMCNNVVVWSRVQNAKVRLAKDDCLLRRLEREARGYLATVNLYDTSSPA